MSMYDIGDGEIGVITPYHAQCLKIRKKLTKGIKVGSVEEFQGDVSAALLFFISPKCSNRNVK